MSNWVIQSGCELAIGAPPGPKAQQILREGNIKFITVENCSIKEAIEKYRKSLEEK